MAIDYEKLLAKYIRIHVDTAYTQLAPHMDDVTEEERTVIFGIENKAFFDKDLRDRCMPSDPVGQALRRQ